MPAHGLEIAPEISRFVGTRGFGVVRLDVTLDADYVPANRSLQDRFAAAGNDKIIPAFPPLTFHGSIPEVGLCRQEECVANAAAAHASLGEKPYKLRFWQPSIQPFTGMNKALEFHDSEVAAVESRGDLTVIHLSKAYVHVSEGVPGVSSGDGYLHEAELTFENPAASCPCNGHLGVISDGFVRVGRERHSLLPLPFEASGDIEAQLQFASGVVLNISAKAVRCVVREPGRWLEAYAG